MKNWLKVFFIFMFFGLLVYFNSMNNKFIIDDYIFLSNPVMSDTKFSLSQWNPYKEQSLGVLDNYTDLHYYRPATHILYDYCYAAFKNSYWKYHFLNLFLLVFASSLIYLLIKKLTSNFNLALFTGLFYLIHPINGILVNYISASVFACQLIFTLGAILLLWESLERKNNRILYILSLVSSFFALFWHESGILTPVNMAVVIFLFRKESFKQKMYYLFPYFLIVIMYLAFRGFISFSGMALKQSYMMHLTIAEYLANLFRVFMWYLSQLFCPQGIVVAWVTNILHDHLLKYVLGACLFPVVFILLFIRLEKVKILQMAIAWMGIGFATASLAALRLPNYGAEVEPHWFVISSIGFFILIAYFINTLLDRMKIYGLAVIFILIFTWCTASHAYNQFWQDQKTYSLYWAKVDPDYKMVNFYIADAYQKEGVLEKARKYYKLALSANSPNWIIYGNLGVLDLQEGLFKDAESNFNKVLKSHPNLAAIHNDLGLVYLKEGRVDEAKEKFERSLTCDPFLLEPRRNLASIFFRNTEYQKAIDLCVKNLEIVNNDPKTLFLLANILVREKDIVNLKKYAYRIIDSQNKPEFLTNFGIIMAQYNSIEIAWDSFQKAIQEDPDYKDAYFNLGVMLASLGKYDDAIIIWNNALKKFPLDNRFKVNIAKAEALKLK